MVDSYRIQHSYFVDETNPEYKGAWNQPHSVARVYTPQAKSIQTPNSDTPYSFLGADLRAEPLVISVPAIPKGRYYSLQFIDKYPQLRLRGEPWEADLGSPILEAELL